MAILTPALVRGSAPLVAIGKLRTETTTAVETGAIRANFILTIEPHVGQAHPSTDKGKDGAPVV